MQTFLPFESFIKSAQVLDTRRLGKQRVECKQILRAMYLGGGWKNHPVVHMWRNYGATLIRYYEVVSAEWKYRGYVHRMELDEELLEVALTEKRKPPWLGVFEFHLHHRNLLVQKDRTHYLPRFEQLEAPVTDFFKPHLLWPIERNGQLTPEYRSLTGLPPHEEPVPWVAW